MTSFMTSQSQQMDNEQIIYQKCLQLVDDEKKYFNQMDTYFNRMVGNEEKRDHFIEIINKCKEWHNYIETKLSVDTLTRNIHFYPMYFQDLQCCISPENNTEHFGILEKVAYIHFILRRIKIANEYVNSENREHDSLSNPYIKKVPLFATLFLQLFKEFEETQQNQEKSNKLFKMLKDMLQYNYVFECMYYYYSMCLTNVFTHLFSNCENNTQKELVRQLIDNCLFEEDGKNLQTFESEAEAEEETNDEEDEDDRILNEYCRNMKKKQQSKFMEYIDFIRPCIKEIINQVYAHSPKNMFIACCRSGLLSTAKKILNDKFGGKITRLNLNKLLLQISDTLNLEMYEFVSNLKTKTSLKFQKKVIRSLVKTITTELENISVHEISYPVNPTSTLTLSNAFLYEQYTGQNPMELLDYLHTKYDVVFKDTSFVTSIIKEYSKNKYFLRMLSVYFMHIPNKQIQDIFQQLLNKYKKGDTLFVKEFYNTYSDYIKMSDTLVTCYPRFRKHLEDDETTNEDFHKELYEVLGWIYSKGVSSVIEEVENETSTSKSLCL